MSPRLTIGMATFNDFDGTYFTVQALRTYHSLVKTGLPEVEIVIVDNSPGTSHSQMLLGLCGHTGAKYVPLQTPVGTSPSRNKVFEAATGDFVLCMDSHVLLIPDAIEKLLDFISNGYTTGFVGTTPPPGQSKPPIGITGPDDLYTGPMLMDNLEGLCTHFNPGWRAEMYGTWGRAWQCPCRNLIFTTQEVAGQVGYYEMSASTKRIGACGNCGKAFPSLGWAAHENQLLATGYKSLGAYSTDEPFEIPGQGLGLFGCRREAWLGFTPHAVGFGGEELNIHELYLQRGRRNICLPFLQWIHKFGRPNGVPYPLQRYHKVRNYVLWHNQLGKPLDDIREHFVATRLMSPGDWDYLIANPVAHTDPPTGCGGCNKQASPISLPEKIEDAYEATLKVERDFNQHMPKLRELADGCAHVTDVSIRQESFIALAASKAETVVSYSNEHNPVTDQVAKLRSMKRMPRDPQDVPMIAPTDLLFLNTRHHADQVWKELSTLGVSSRHYIVLHNTVIYGETGENSTPEAPQPGILPACRRFMREHPEWSVIYHTPMQYGLTVLSCRPEDKKSLPGKLTLLANFSKALAEHVLDGAQKSEPDVFEKRLDTCMGCEYRNDENCSVCGCDIKAKASWRSADCPLGKWPVKSEIPG